MDYKQNFKLLRRDFDEGREFTLFVGAGINASKNVKLLWNDLVKKACEVSFRQIARSLELSSQDTALLLSILGIKDTRINKIPKIDAICEKFETTTDKSQLDTLVSELRDIISNYIGLKDYVAIHFPVEIQVSIIKTLLGDSYIPFIQDNLYSQCNREVIKNEFKSYQITNPAKTYTPNGLFSLFIIARMVLLNPQIKSIITYNYDNFLTFAVCHLLHHCDKFFKPEEIEFLRLRYGVEDDSQLRKIIPAKDIYNADMYIHRKEQWSTTPIYHVHGFIPPFEDLQYENAPDIILSSDEYMSSIGDSTSWNLSAQLNSILTTDTLFIGSSITDLSTKRMINIAAEQGIKRHRYVLDAYDKNKYPNEKIILRKIKNSYLETLGVRVIDCQDDFGNLFLELSTIKDKHLKS